MQTAGQFDLRKKFSASGVNFKITYSFQTYDNII